VQKGAALVRTGVEIGIHAFPTPVIVIDIKISCAFAIGSASSDPYASAVYAARADVYAARADGGEAEHRLRSARARIDRYV